MAIAHVDLDGLKTFDSFEHGGTFSVPPHLPKPFGILSVSSFYGPCSFTAWLITLLCALTGGSSFSFTSFFLYPLVASIDLIQPDW